MEDLSRKRIKEVRQEMKDGKRDEKGYPDLLTLMRTCCPICRHGS
jgi:hypothetical protein